jgi:hypothetical protein
MDNGIAESFRLSLVLSLLAMTTQTVPEISLPVRRPFLVLLRKFRELRSFLGGRRKPAGKKRSFWEIDMTQLEP